jgi:hypothetical protein
MAGCGGGDENTAGTGAVSGGGAGGTNPTSGGTGGMNPASGGTSGNPASGGTGGGGTGGVPQGGDGGGGASGGGAGGSLPPGECGGGIEVMCASDTDIRADSTCEDAASGVFAIKTVIDVWWQDDIDPPLVDPGRGPLTVYLKGTLSDVCSDGSSGCGEMMGCGTILPTFVSWVNCTAYQITFPDELWDNPAMPKFYTTGSVDMFEPGGILNIAKATGLVGFAMDNADEGAWPASINDVTCMGMAAGDPTSCFPDHDNDMLPGVSIVMGKVGENYLPTGCYNLNTPDGTGPVKYQGAPLDALVSGLCDPATDPSCKRATNMSIGLRTRLGGGGAIAACDASGAAHGSGAADADFLDSRVAGCKDQDGTPCTIEQVEFVDSSAPNYKILDMGMAPPNTVMASACDCPGGCTGEACPVDQTPSVGSRSAVVRLGDAGMNFTCADVRTAVEAQYPGTDI